MNIVFQIKNKQYKCYKNQIIKVDKLNYEKGKEIEINKILIISDENNLDVGMPFILNKKLKIQILDHKKDKKIKIIKFKRRKHYKKQMGHRQDFTNIKIMDIIN